MKKLQSDFKAHGQANISSRKARRKPRGRMEVVSARLTSAFTQRDSFAFVSNSSMPFNSTLNAAQKSFVTKGKKIAPASFALLDRIKNDNDKNIRNPTNTIFHADTEFFAAAEESNKEYKKGTSQKK